MHHDTGQSGESTASEFLLTQGYKIIDRNFRTPLGEIDIIACKGSLLVFVEVKTLAGGSGFNPEMHFTKSKLLKMKRTIAVYLKQKHIIDTDYRLDLVAIELDAEYKLCDLRHYENITM